MVTLNSSDAVDLEVVNDDKIVTLWDDGYYVKTLSNCTGTLNIEVNEKGYINGAVRSMTFDNIPLDIGTLYKQGCGEDYYDDQEAYAVEALNGEKIEATSDSLITKVLLPVSVTYNATGGTTAQATETVKEGEYVILPTANRLGYTFLGWANSNDATKAEYIPGDLISLNEDTTLYAVWFDFELPLYGSAATGVIDYIPITYGGQVFYYSYTPKTSEQYIIYSVCDSDTKVILYDASGNKITSNDNGGEGNNFQLVQSLTAGTTYYYAVSYTNSTQTGRIMVKFGRVFTVNFNANGGTGAPSAQKKYFHLPLTLSSTIPNKSYTISFDTNADNATVFPTSKSVNCTFSCWSTGQSGDGFKFNAGESYTFDSSRTLYAQWTDGQAGALPTPTRRGYTFDGWYTASSGGKKVTDSSTISADTELYAHWTISPVTIVGCDILSTPKKVSYYYKEKTDISGITLNIRYSDGSSETITDTDKMTFSGLTTSSVGTKTVTVTYEDVSASFNITVKYAWWQILIRIFLLGFIWY